MRRESMTSAVMTAYILSEATKTSLARFRAN
jgi:hypothetical protein